MRMKPGSLLRHHQQNSGNNSISRPVYMKVTIELPAGLFARAHRTERSRKAGRVRPVNRHGHIQPVITSYPFLLSSTHISFMDGLGPKVNSGE